MCHSPANLLFWLFALAIVAISAFDGHWPERLQFDRRDKDLPICRVCVCDRALRSVQCLPGTQNTGGHYRLRMVRLPHWAESFSAMNLSQPDFPHFAAHSQLRQLRILHSALQRIPPMAFVPLPNLELVQLAHNHIQTLPADVFVPLGHLRVLDLAGNRLSSAQLNLAKADHSLEQLILDQNPLCPGPNSGTFPLARQIRLAQTGVVAVEDTQLLFRQLFNASVGTKCSPLPFPASNWLALEELHLDSNPSLHLTASSLAQLAHLHVLRLSRIGSVPESLFSQWTTRLETKWRHLDLHGTPLIPSPAFDYSPFGEDVELADAVRAGRKGRMAQWTFCSRDLEWLDLGGILLDGELHLGGCQKLKWLYADDNHLDALHFGDNGPRGLLSLSMRANRLRHFPAALLGAGPTLLSLNLANNSVRHLPSDQQLDQFPALQQLDMAQNRLRHFQLFSPPDSLLLDEPLLSPRPHPLAFLNLSHNHLLSLDISPSYSSSANFPALAVLDLSANRLAQLDLTTLLHHLPALEHFHLALNPGIKLSAIPRDGHSALGQLDLANCSLFSLPDLSRMFALRELNLQGNRLEGLPGDSIPRQGLSVLDASGNNIRRIGWDWSHGQLTSLIQLRLDANPLDCACPMPKSMARLIEREKGANKNSAYCMEGHWRHPLDAFLLPDEGPAMIAPEECPVPGLVPSPAAALGGQPRGGGFGTRGTEPSLLALFLLPFVLIIGAVGGTLILLRGSTKWTAVDQHWPAAGGGASSTSTMFAYEPVPNEQIADCV